MIIVTCKKACAETSCHRPLLTAGMSNAEIVHFVFSEEWDGLAKTAVFTDSVITVDVLQAQWNGDEVAVPPDVTTTAGRRVRVGVYGTDGNGVALPTIWTELGTVRAGADPSGDSSTKPVLPVWAQLQEQIGNLADLKTDSKDNLVAAINEALQSGSGGGGGYQIGSGLKLDAETNTLSVDTAAAVEKDNTKPVTSAAVYTEVGNINAMLATI